jgi:hypothetical protein
MLFMAGGIKGPRHIRDFQGERGGEEKTPELCGEAAKT